MFAVTKVGCWFNLSKWRRKWQPTPVFLPGEFHRQRSLVGYSPQNCKESALGDQHFHFQTQNFPDHVQDCWSAGKAHSGTPSWACRLQFPVVARACMLSHFSLFWLFATPWTAACQAPLSMGFSRQQDWNGLPFLIPGDLPDPGDWTCGSRISCTGKCILYHCTTLEALSPL